MKTKRATKRQVRKPKPYLIDVIRIPYLGNAEVTFSVDKMPLKKARKHHAWLTRAIDYLEARDDIKERK